MNMSFGNESYTLEHNTESGLNDDAQNNVESPGHEEVAPPESNYSNNSASYSESDSDDDDYFLSDDEELDNINSNMDDGRTRMHYSTSMSDHVAYLSNSLTHALDSLQLDKSLVLQAQLSGQLNNEKQKIIDKRKEVVDKIENLKNLYAYNFLSACNHSLKSSVSRVDKLQQDITEIENRIEKLKSGPSKNNSSTFGAMFKSKKQNMGIANRYPIEYNQAKDKVLERQIEE